ncbi:E3 ubiquitin-protein ligase SIAH1B-like isoform X2 [Scylla paramamosain]|uniref:E3 ubiquitin-protein ligase SIAH1B-like isoform X3 n=1 Tax=Scylla paramamosain TaxID=85552 RepID=UPI0030832601
MCPCPSASCKWQGSLEQVMPHLMSVHKSITTLQGEDIVFLATDIKLPGAVDWVMIQSCFSHHFILVLGKQEKFDGHQQFFAIVQLIGFRKQAENFAYSFSLHRAPPSSTREARVRKIPQDLFIDIVESLRQHRGQHRLPATSLGLQGSSVQGPSLSAKFEWDLTLGDEEGSSLQGPSLSAKFEWDLTLGDEEGSSLQGPSLSAKFEWDLTLGDEEEYVPVVAIMT